MNKPATSGRPRELVLGMSWAFYGKANLRSLLTVVQKALKRLMSENQTYQRIHLTDYEGGLFVRFRDSNFQLRCNAGEPRSIDLSLDEVRDLFASMTTACERQEMTQIEIGDLSWTTDARLNEKRPDRISVRFSGSLGLGIIGLSRRRVRSACEEFWSIFGHVSSTSGVGFEG